VPHRFAAGLLALAMTIPALAACGSDDASDDGGTQDLTVWLMKDTATDEFVRDFEAAFEKDHPEYALTVQIQEWDGITEKVTGALASTDPPDVIEVGNTQVAQYAASGGVTDLSGKVGELAGDDWLPGLAEPARSTASSSASRSTRPTGSSSTARTCSPTRESPRRPRGTSGSPRPRG
jgi:N,N'-diacetylchitobiose transport system substrate-binding protein